MPTAKLRLGVELLEGRDCPAVNFFNGVLTVTGTGGNDSLIVSQNGSVITAQGQSFNAALVNRIVITGQDGNDFIRNRTGKTAHLYGGFGNDSIYGGSVVDRMYGGHATDILVGGAGNDVLFGGQGTDTLNGGTGTNSLYQGSPGTTRTNSAIETQIIQLVNAERAVAGLPPLTVNLQLNQAAWMHTLDMVNISNLYGPDTAHQHTLFGTARPFISDRLDAAGYDNWTTGFAYGENIAYGYASAAAVMNAWMDSPGHRANILSTTFREIGVAVGLDNSGRLFFTQNFGYRA